MKLPEDLRNLIIKECLFNASKSQGPGGQHVNKANTRMEISFNIQHTDLFSEEEKARIMTKLGTKISANGNIIMYSQRYRSQIMNREDVEHKLISLLEYAIEPEKIRKKTKPSKAASEERLLDKKKTSEKKINRRKPKL